MRKIREVLRLHFEQKFGRNQIVRVTGVSKGSVSGYLKRARKVNLPWPLPENLGEVELDKLLFPQKKISGKVRYEELNFQYLQDQLRNKTVTLQLLWEEYQGRHAEGAYYEYSQFCHHYRQWHRRLAVTMRQAHKAGDKTFFDYCGPTVGVINGETGEVWQAQIFVAVLGASNYTFCEATRTQSMPDWVASHERACRYFGGVTTCWVPDNLRSAVTKADRFDPELNVTYEALAEHYGAVVMPARPYKPRDKAAAEVGVQVVERWIIARLRHQQFFSLGELNQAIAVLLVRLNTRIFKKMPGCSRLSQFEKLDKPVLKALPIPPFEFFIQEKVRVGFDYHVKIEGHFYSLPYTLAKKDLEAKVRARTVEFLYQGQRVALHVRSFNEYGWTTLKEHMPKGHQAHADWTPGRILNWALSIGHRTVQVTRCILESGPYPEQNFRRCAGLLSLAKKYTPLRLEAACSRAASMDTCNLRSVTTILKNGADLLPLPQASPQEELFTDHANLRGPDYYVG